MKSYVYLLYNTVNGKLYVGKARNPTNRLARHIRTAKGGRTKYANTFSTIHAAISKYGADKFIMRTVEDCLDDASALVAERNWISTLKENGCQLYNMTDGGDGSIGFKHSPKTIANMIGEGNPFYGKNHSEETKTLISKAGSGGKNPHARLSDNDVSWILNLWNSEPAQKRSAYGFKSSFWRERILPVLQTCTYGMFQKITTGLTWKS